MNDADGITSTVAGSSQTQYFYTASDRPSSSTNNKLAKTDGRRNLFPEGRSEGQI